MRTRWPMEGLGGLAVLGILALGVTGWVLNILKIAEADTVTPMVIVRCIGTVVVFLGMVLGWIG